MKNKYDEVKKQIAERANKDNSSHEQAIYQLQYELGEKFDELKSMLDELDRILDEEISSSGNFYPSNEDEKADAVDFYHSMVENDQFERNIQPEF